MAEFGRIMDSRRSVFRLVFTDTFLKVIDYYGHFNDNDVIDLINLER